jgi:hypothetical protein
MTRRPSILLPLIALMVIALAVPVLAAKPSSPPGQAKEKVPSTPITLNGTIQTAADADGETTYTLRDGGTTYTLGAGPKWFFGGAYPLDPYVGENVTIEGEIAEGTTEVDVISVNGVALREAGKPPWAGGWKRVGSAHPGWSQDKADRFADKADRFGGCFPPGQCKDKSGKPVKPDKPDAPDGVDEPDGEVPEVTDAPEATDAPDATDAPEITDTPPEITDAPEITDTPDETDFVVPTDAPESATSS